MAICRECGESFDPRREYHRLCDRCYLAETGRIVYDRYHWARHPESVLVMMVIGVVVLLLMRACGLV